MLDSLISLLAPHLCFSCGAIGANLCDYCKYDIENEYFDGCILCGKLANKNGICATCHPPYSKAWCVGERSGVLGKLIDSYKFQRNYAAHKDLAGLVSDCIGVLPTNAVIVPIPTISSHRRQRGYDHTLFLAKALSRRQGVPPLVYCKEPQQRHSAAVIKQLGNIRRHVPSYLRGRSMKAKCMSLLMTLRQQVRHSTMLPSSYAEQAQNRYGLR